jgi:hypothetical protein
MPYAPLFSSGKFYNRLKSHQPHTSICLKKRNRGNQAKMERFCLKLGTSYSHQTKFQRI